jgi:O-antigen ligase
MKLYPFIALKREYLLKLLIVLFIFSIFFPIRHVFKSESNFATGAYSDFTSISLYSCDLLIIALFLVLLGDGGWSKKLTKPLLLLTAWLIMILLGRINSQIGLNIYFFFKILELFVLHETFKNYGHSYKDIIAKTLVLFGFLESLLAIFQFLYQRSLGFYKIGEQHIDPLTLGVAKIGLNMLKFVRGYGTFPHPNLLSAFLFTCTIFGLYLLLGAKSKIQRIYYSIILVFTIFGLFITFSRAGLLALAVTLIVFFLLNIRQTGLQRKIGLPAVIALVTILSASLLLKPFILARTDLSTDQSAKERIFYTKIGLKIIKAHPITGTGIGTSVLHMKQYSPVELKPWEIQPIHNYFLLAAAELGIVGAIILIYLFISYLKNLFLLVWNKNTFSIYRLSLLCILIGYLILMFFDHYFYTIEQTQILLWMVLGLVAAEILNNKKSTI